MFTIGLNKPSTGVWLTRSGYELDCICSGLEFFGAAEVLAVPDVCNVFIRVARMASWLILVVMFIYGAIAVDFAIKGNWAMTIVWGGYCASNWGLYLLSKEAL
jgi:hypothetical protein